MSTSIKSTLALLVLLVVITTSCHKNDTSFKEDNLPDVTGYPIVGTEQSIFYNNDSEISEPKQGDAFYGQNANYPGPPLVIPIMEMEP